MLDYQLFSKRERERDWLLCFSHAHCFEPKLKECLEFSEWGCGLSPSGLGLAYGLLDSARESAVGLAQADL